MDSRRALGLGIGLIALKLVLAARMGLIGDEAFYWQCSRRLDWGYADQPPATALLVAAGTAALGPSLLGVRAAFLAAGAALPWASGRWAGALGAGPGALWFLAMPLGAALGVLAVPDVLLALATLALAIALAEAVRAPGPAAWARVGLAGLVGLLVHFRLGFTLAGVGVFFLATARGRALARTPGPWLAAALAALGLVPTALFNAAHGWPALAYQLRDRHPWTFSAAGLLHPLEQAAVVTPGLYVLLLLALARALRGAARGEVPAQLAACLAGVHLALVAGLAPFADPDAFVVHWPLPAYLLLAPLLPGTLGALGARAPRLGAGLGVLALGGGGLGCVLLAGSALDSAFPGRLPRVLLGSGPEVRTMGWEAIAARVAARLAALDPGAPVVVARGWGAAQLDFHLGGRAPAFLLDFGRTRGPRPRVQELQYRLWGRDAAGLARLAGRAGIGVVVVDDGRPFGAAADPQVETLARHATGVVELERLALLGGAKQVGIYRLEGLRPEPAEPDPARIDRPVLAWLDAPAPGTPAGEGLEIAGWAFCDSGGVAAVEALVDGGKAGSLGYGLPRPDVRERVAPRSRDPAHPRVGFAGRVGTAGLAPGEHLLTVRVTTGRGRREDLPPVPFLVGPPAAR